MIANRVTALLKAEPARVFACLVEEALLMRWIGGLLESRQTVGDAPGSGATYRQVLLLDGKREVVERVITGYDPETHLAYRIKAADLDLTGAFDLEPEGGTTHFSYRQETHGRSLAFTLLKPVVTARIQRKIESDLAALKRLVERPGTSG